MGIYMRPDQLLFADLIDGEVTINALRRLSVILPLRPEYVNSRADIMALSAMHGFDASLKNLAMVDMTGCAQIVLDTDRCDTIAAL